MLQAAVSNRHASNKVTWRLSPAKTGGSTENLFAFQSLHVGVLIYQILFEDANRLDWCNNVTSNPSTKQPLQKTSSDEYSQEWAMTSRALMAAISRADQTNGVLSYLRKLRGNPASKPKPKFLPPSSTSVNRKSAHHSFRLTCTYVRVASIIWTKSAFLFGLKYVCMLRIESVLIRFLKSTVFCEKSAVAPSA